LMRVSASSSRSREEKGFMQISRRLMSAGERSAR
jgi:hypothetical protein